MFEEKFDQLLSWGRYLHWSDLNFQKYFSFGNDKSLNKGDAVGDMLLLAFVSQWLASLYVVLEGWQELNEKDERIDKILNISKKHHNLLRRHRNAVFHYQPSLFDKKFSEITKEGISTLIWAVALELEFQRYFWEWPEKHLITKEQKTEARKLIETAIGWIPVEIFAAEKDRLRKINEEANEMLEKAEDKNSAHSLELKEAVDMGEAIIQETIDLKIEDIINTIRNGKIN